MPIVYSLYTLKCFSGALIFNTLFIYLSKKKREREKSNQWLILSNSFPACSRKSSPQWRLGVQLPKKALTC